MALSALKVSTRIGCRALQQKINCTIPAAHQTLVVQCMSASSTAKVREYARSPYILFSMDKGPELRQANPGVNMPGIFRMVGQLWRVLPDAEKQVYQARYLEEKEVVKAANEEKFAAMSKEEKAELQAAERDRRKQRKLRRRRKLKREFGKPKLGDVNPFVVFMKSKTVERGDAPVVQYLKGLAEHWKMMPVEDKEEYIEQARENSKRYQQQLLEWEKSMVAEGHPELVRRRHLKKAPQLLKPKPAKKAQQRAKKTARKATSTQTAKGKAAAGKKAAAAEE